MCPLGLCVIDWKNIPIWWRVGMFNVKKVLFLFWFMSVISANVSVSVRSQKCFENVKSEWIRVLKESSAFIVRKLLLMSKVHSISDFNSIIICIYSICDFHFYQNNCDFSVLAAGHINHKHSQLTNRHEVDFKKHTPCKKEKKKIYTQT